MGGPRIIRDKGQWIVTIQAEVFGGHQLYGLWEVADIAFFISIRHKKKIQRVKIGLLQSKRLYPKEIKKIGKFPLTAVDRLFFGQSQNDLFGKPKVFHFNDQCKYLKATDQQQLEAIQSFVKRSKISVDYLFYNPWQLPFNIRLPQTSVTSFSSSPPLGARVMPSDVVIKHVHLNNTAPSFNDLQGAFRSLPQEKTFGSKEPGWRIENWISDLLLTCKLGYSADNFEDESIRENLFGRNHPISAAISITIDSPDQEQYATHNDLKN